MQPENIATSQQTIYARPRRSTVGHWIAIIILLVILGGSVLLNLGLIVLTASKSALKLGETSRGGAKYSEEFIEGSGGSKVACIELFGVIAFGEERSGFLFREESVADRILKQIEQAEKDSHVIAIMLVVDSPGGGVTASDIIYERLLKFKKSGNGKRKVVALMRDVAASGGYYVSAAADKIVAHRTTITGSIGVLISALNVKQLGDKYGIRGVTITSGKNKDLLNPFGEVRTEHTNILQQTVNDMYERFVSIVAHGRGLTPEKVRELADGRIYTAPQALELSLVDEIGYWEDAVELMKKLTDCQKFKVVRYKRSTSLADLLSSHFNHSIQLPIPPQWMADTPRFQYLWQPEL